MTRVVVVQLSESIARKREPCKLNNICGNDLCHTVERHYNEHRYTKHHPRLPIFVYKVQV